LTSTYTKLKSHHFSNEQSNYYPAVNYSKIVTQHQKSYFLNVQNSRWTSSAAENVGKEIQKVVDPHSLPWLDDQMFAKFFESLLVNLHDLTGLPYWEVIILFTFGIRVFLMYFNAKSFANTARMALVQPEIATLLEKGRNAGKRGDKNAMINFNMQIREVYATHKVSPLATLGYGLLQVLCLANTFFAIRRMCQINPDFKTGGYSFWMDLTSSSVDPFYALPIFSWALFALNIWKSPDSETPLSAKWRFIIIAFLAFVHISTAFLPKAVFIYWTANGILSFIQGMILRHPRVRKFFNIPKVDPSLRKPIVSIKDMMNMFGNKDEPEPQPKTFTTKPTQKRNL